MARTSVIKVNGKRVRAKLAPEQKAERRKYRLQLATDLATTRQEFLKEAADLAKQHGRYIDFYLFNYYITV